jgi:hypothetical protein
MLIRAAFTLSTTSFATHGASFTRAGAALSLADAPLTRIRLCVRLVAMSMATKNL